MGDQYCVDGLSALLHGLAEVSPSQALMKHFFFFFFFFFFFLRTDGPTDDGLE